MRPAGGLLPLQHSECENALGKHCRILPAQHFAGRIATVVRPFGGMGNLESRRPSSGGGLFTFSFASHQRRGAKDRGEYRQAAGVACRAKWVLLAQMRAARSSQGWGRVCVTEPPRPPRVKRPTWTGDQAQLNGDLRMPGESVTFVRCFLGQGSRRISPAVRASAKGLSADSRHGQAGLYWVSTLPGSVGWSQRFESARPRTDKLQFHVAACFLR